MIDKLYELITRIGITTHQDKVLHFIAGLIVGAISMYFVDVWSILAVLSVAVGKEVYDKFIKGTYMDLYDVLATVAGGWIAIALVGIIGG